MLWALGRGIALVVIPGIGSGISYMKSKRLRRDLGRKITEILSWKYVDGEEGLPMPTNATPIRFVHIFIHK